MSDSSKSVYIRTPSSVVGEMFLDCGDAGDWEYTLERIGGEGEVEIFRVVCSAPAPTVPKPIAVRFSVPMEDIDGIWSPREENVTVPPEWGAGRKSSIIANLPLCSLVGGYGQNRMTFACSDATRPIEIHAGTHEQTSRINCMFYIFLANAHEEPFAKWEALIRVERGGTFSDAVQRASKWIADQPRYRPQASPADAFEPLYSTWYAFHHDLLDTEVEAECAEAAAMGMKVLIVDAGWQTDDPTPGFAHAGDWEISRKRFPDMAAHVRRVHALGMKYMVWFGLTLAGSKSRAHELWDGKTFTSSDIGEEVLDPRFPEVREHLAGVLEKAVREWDLDGLKLDFVDALQFAGEDPAVAQNFAGRDIHFMPTAIDALFVEIKRRLDAVKPGLLIEFRQGYTGPAIRKYANMLRASDCPGSIEANRIRTANLRLTTGGAAVHSDMLEWDVASTPEDAARQILASLFSVIQYSMMLRRLPAAHREMLQHWLDFTVAHRDTLLHGEFIAADPVANYPVLAARGRDETVLAVYRGETVADIPADSPTVFLVNASWRTGLTVRFAGKPASVALFDTFGHPAGMIDVPAAGLTDLPVPKSGHAEIRFA